MKIYANKTDSDYDSVILPIVNQLKKKGLFTGWIKRGALFPKDGNIYLCSTPVDSWTRKLPVKAKLIAIAHGAGGDSPDIYQNPRFDYIIVPGPYWLKYWAHVPLVRNKLIPLGFPKTDIIFKDQYLVRDQLKKEISFKFKYSYNLLYAPGGANGIPSGLLDSFETSIFPIIKFSEKVKVNLIVKEKSHATWTRGEICKQARKYAKKSKHITWIKKLDNICRLYHIGNILLGDGSSVIREYYLKNRPSFQLINFKWTKFIFPEAVHRTLENLESIRAGFGNGKKFLISDKIKRNLFYKLDGKATERIVNFIIKNGEE